MADDFGLPPNTAVFTCKRVLEGAPILRVTHDGDGDWQFLCGGDHSDVALCPGGLVSLSEVLKMDPTLAELSDLCGNWTATRNTGGGEWARHDGYEEIVRDHIREFGWHVTLIESDGKEPGFAYSIGLFHSYQQPEIIIFGVPVSLMHSIVNSCGDTFKAGRSIKTGVPLNGYIRDFPVVFKEVRKERYREYFGYGLWYYSGPMFPALQCIWPDKKGHFPWDPECNPAVLPIQPLLV